MPNNTTKREILDNLFWLDKQCVCKCKTFSVADDFTVVCQDCKRRYTTDFEPIHNTTTDTWEQLFDDKFGVYIGPDYDWNQIGLVKQELPELKDFIRTQISLAEQRGAERVINEIPAGWDFYPPGTDLKSDTTALKERLRTKFLNK